ncbi:MAG TPA: outer membrane protein assembly factor BamD [Candidatus Binataceae bacterium]|nr:outer membrane protein assembly factor BamD [Candidatus Binataceae bacterium]
MRVRLFDTVFPVRQSIGAHSIGRIAALALATAGLFVAGCTSQADMQQLNQNQFTLRGMIASDRQQIDALGQQVRQLRDQVTEIQHGGAASGSSDQLSQANDRIAKLQSEVSALQAGMAAQPGAPAVGTAPGASTIAPGGAPGPGGETASAAPVFPAPTWPDELDQEISNAESSKDAGVKIYRVGLKAMKDAKYPLAVANFTRLQHQYPKSPLVEPADYFAANALYETGKYDQAILQFNDLVMRYPKGRFAAQALLRQAEAFVKMNDRIDARLTLQKLQSDHDGTPQAAAAKTMMASLVSE